MSDKHEYCPGYRDENGMWNTGFYCPKWGGPDGVYCCGSPSNPHCCAEPTNPPSTLPSIPDDQLPLIPIIIAASTGVFVVIVVVLIGCFFCRCCPGYRVCNKQTDEENKQNEATAALEQASRPLTPPTHPAPTHPNTRQTIIPAPVTQHQGTTYLAPEHHHHSQASLSMTVTSDNSTDSHHQCGCNHFTPSTTLTRHRQSPNPIIHSPAADALEKLKFTMYENPFASFHKDDDSQSGSQIGRASPHCSGEKYPKPVALPDPANLHISPNNTIKRKSQENPFGRPLCLETFRGAPRSPSPLAPMPPIHFRLDAYRPDSGVLMDDVDIDTLVNLARKHEKYSTTNTYTGTR